MERLIERCAGLDVHKATVAACVRLPGAGKRRARHIRTFGTTTRELGALRGWLAEHGVTHVALESTGVYWKCVYYTLEDPPSTTAAQASAWVIAEAFERRARPVPR